MANTVIALKKSGTPSATPGSLANGELAINYADGKLFYKAANGSILSLVSANASTASFGTVNANGTLIIADYAGSILTLKGNNGITISGDSINDEITIGLNSTITSQIFTGDGSNTNYILSSNVLAQNNVIVSVNGLLQIPTTHYSVTGNTLSFTSAPRANSRIEARNLVNVAGGSSGGTGSISDLSETFTSVFLLGL
jgi:hypothetical protein